MITIKPRQLNLLGDEIFIDKAIKHLSEHYDNFARLEKKEARSFVIVNRDISMACYDFIAEKAVMTYILVAWEIGADFHEKNSTLKGILLNNTKTDIDRAFELYCEVYKQLKTTE